MMFTDHPPPRPSLPIRLITYNIRYAASHRAPNEEPWPIRCPKLATQLQFTTSGFESAFICHQEVLHPQLQDLARQLGPRWAYIGQGRDGGTEGEYSPIFYVPHVWKCDDWRTIWLSETPNVPSRGWDAVLNRIVTVGEFTHRRTGVRIVVMSTHFDHVGTKAREESAKLIVSVVREVREGRNGRRAAAVILGGDFNSQPDDLGYKIITAPDSGLVDVRGCVAEEKRYGNEHTYTSFGETDDAPKRIDFLFVTNDAGSKVATYGVLSNRFDDGVYISDHRPVVADLELHL